MQAILRGAVVLGALAAALPAWAGDRERALAVVEKAIKAHGGAEALSRAAVAERRGQGTMTQPGAGEVPFTNHEVVSLPDRVRLAVRLGPGEIVIVLGGDKGWIKPAGGGTFEMRKNQLDEYREKAYVWWLATLAPLQKDGFDLAPVPDGRVNGREAAGVKVSRKGYADATLWFDKQSGLLVKIAHRVSVAGAPVDEEYLYTDHKEWAGAKLPGREVMSYNGRKVTEVKYTDWKLQPRVEDGTFARP
jgi:hypothetical protein